MNPPKYKFYIGAALENVVFKNRTTIDDNGDIIQGIGPHMYASQKTPIEKSNRLMFFNLTSVSPYDAVFFYDTQGHLVQRQILKDLKESTVSIPRGSSKWAVRLTTLGNADFVAKKDSDFIYSGEFVLPHYKKLNKKYTKESNQEFFRTSIEGKIQLFGNDYRFVGQSDIEDRFIFIIDKYNLALDAWATYYKGEFSKSDCKFDHDREMCELKTKALDAYSNILDKYDNTYDLIKLAPAISKIGMHKRSLMQVYVRGASSVTNFFGGVYWEDDVNQAVDSHKDLVNKYYFSEVKIANEILVKGAGISGVNGTYAGADGAWDHQDGYVCYFAGTGHPLDYKFICIKRTQDNKTLYQSIESYDASSGTFPSKPVRMVNVDDDSDRIFIDGARAISYHIYRRLLCDVDEVMGPEGTIKTYDLPPDDFVTDNRNYKKCIGLTGGLFFCTTKTVSTPTKFGLNDDGRYFTNMFLPSFSGWPRALPVSRNSWANASLWFMYDSFYDIFEEILRKPYTLKDSYSIGAAIKAILKKIDPAISHEPTAEYSQFLYGDTNPLGMERFYVYIAQKTNILKGNYDQPAQKAETSLEDLMKMLRDCFRCFWYIEDNKLKIEHIHFFMNGGSYSRQEKSQLDFTKLTDAFNKKSPLYFQSAIEFDKSELAQRYEFSWMDDATDLFDGLALDVKSNYTQKDKTEEINANRFSADVDFMLFNPSNFSNDGFALLCPIKKDRGLELPIVEIPGLIDDSGARYTAIAQNWYASWLYLQAFYMWDAPAEHIISNSTGRLYVRDIKKCMKHTIEIPVEEDPNEIELIRTQFGKGKIDEMTINLDSRRAKINLVYQPR